MCSCEATCKESLERKDLIYKILKSVEKTLVKGLKCLLVRQEHCSIDSPGLLHKIPPES